MTVDFKAFATGPGANVLPQADYVVLPAVATGYVAGLAKSVELNKTWRQSSFVAAAIATFMAEQTATDVLDDGDLDAFVDKLEAAISEFVSSITAANGGCILTVTNSIALKIAPRDSNIIRIDGAPVAIPAAGIAVANTNVNVGGVAGQNLAASTDYLLFLKADLTPSFWTLATGHITSITAGNVGVEVRNNAGAPDDDYTLIGMVGTNAASEFEDSLLFRLCLNWFGASRRNKPSLASNSTIPRNNTGALAEISATLRATVLTWADEAVLANCDGYAANDTVAAVPLIQLARDGVLSGSIAGNYTPAINADSGFSVSYQDYLTEGRHVISPFNSQSAGTTNFNQIYNRVQIRG